MACCKMSGFLGGIICKGLAAFENMFGDVWELGYVDKLSSKFERQSMRKFGIKTICKKWL